MIEGGKLGREGKRRKAKGKKDAAQNMREKEKGGHPLKRQRGIGRGERVFSCLVLS